MKEQEAEIKSFYFSLTSEKKTFTRPLISILNAQIISTRQKDGVTIGIAGIIDKTLFVCVKEGFQGRGIGRELTENVINEAKKKGYERVSLATKTSNLRAIKMYESLGFKKMRYDHSQRRIEMILPLTFKGILVMIIGRFSYVVCCGNNNVWQQFLLCKKIFFA